MRRIADVDVRGKTVLVRADLNCPVDNGKLIGDARIRAHAGTIKGLSDRGARVVILSHQGREGRDDFIGLEQHAKILHHLIGRDVVFMDVVGEDVAKAIKRLNDGGVLMLDNVRKLRCETEHPDGDGEIVHHLSPLADYYVLDALSVAHRKHSSVVGFAKHMPCFAGDVLAAEVEAVDKIRHGKDVTFIFGGSKADDSFKIMDQWLSDGRAREVLVGGALAVLLIRAAGHKVGESEGYLKDSKLDEKIPDARGLLERFDGKIVLPLDVGLSVKTPRADTGGSKLERKDSAVDAITEGQIWDIGDKTAERYIQVINNSHFVVMNGPLGVYEVDDFSKGTKAVLEAIARSDAFSLLGGGHTVSAIERFGIDKKNFGYVSLSGKALMRYLCGKELPGLSVLDENEKKFPLS
ncbi:MAG: phosphoglycerate kinase [Candidatus Micrarchaeota archaeon]